MIDWLMDHDFALLVVSVVGGMVTSAAGIIAASWLVHWAWFNVPGWLS